VGGSEGVGAGGRGVGGGGGEEGGGLSLLFSLKMKTIHQETA
jgi:hypothetical protein